MNRPVPQFPRVVVTIHPDTTGEVSIQGVRYAVPATGNAETSRRAALDLVARRAATVLCRAVHVTAYDEQGAWSLIVHPDGRVDADGGHR